MLKWKIKQRKKECFYLLLNENDVPIAFIEFTSPVLTELFSTTIANAPQTLKQRDNLLEAAKNLLKALENCPGSFNYNTHFEDKLREAIISVENNK